MTYHREMNNEKFYDLLDGAIEMAEDPGTIGLLRAARHHESIQSGEEVPLHLKGLREDIRPRRGLWAPGDYLCSCIRCKINFIGDKRAGHCSDCAYQLMPVDEEEIGRMSDEEKAEWRAALKDLVKSPLLCGCDDPETCEDRDDLCPPTVRP
jgi:hypothetical protein